MGTISVTACRSEPGSLGTDADGRKTTHLRQSGEVTILPEEFDRDPWKLNVLNGTLDLQTGELRPHRRDDLLTKLAPVAFDPETECPWWEKFLGRVVPDEDDRTFLKQAIGYSLTG